ncbi:MAG: HEAT repeat domain-containing protein [Sandaracinaceae bacterium]|nr:HEAT repeat domain-containing protein [Sandaracinaceae bacterium]
MGALACAAVALLALVSTALADQRSDYLVRVLRTSPMFRVRAQAAISLGGVQAEPQVIEALSGALRDEHPAVRAAAAAALERHGDPSALPALQRVANDSEPAVRNAVSRAVGRLQSIQRTRPRTVPTGPDTAPPLRPPTRVLRRGSARPGTTVSSVDRRSLDELQTFLEGQLRAMSGVEVAPGSQSAAAANRVLRERRLVGYYLDSSIVEVTSRPEGDACARLRGGADLSGPRHPQHALGLRHRHRRERAGGDPPGDRGRAARSPARPPQRHGGRCQPMRQGAKWTAVRLSRYLFQATVR